MSKDEYSYAVMHGFEPLIDKQFAIAIKVRIQIQNEIFGHSLFNKGDVVEGNQRFYEWCWYHLKHYCKCQNCFYPLEGYSASFVSHILSRSNRPDIAHDPRNVNILCLKCHGMWEHPTQRKKMAIYRQNKETIIFLTEEYKFAA